MTTIDTYEIASSIIDDVCMFRPEFVGVDFTSSAIIDLIESAFGYIEQHLENVDATTSKRAELLASVRLEIMAMCLSCSTDNAERIYNERKAA